MSKNDKVVKQADDFLFGSKYIGDREAVSELYKKWDQILADEGFKDIEFRTEDGRFSPYFVGKGSTSVLVPKFNNTAQFFYEKTREFVHVCDWNQFRPYGPLYKQIWIYYSEGVSFRDMEKLFMGVTLDKYADVKPVTGLLRRKSSYYFYFTHTHKIQDAFWLWLSAEGIADPRSFKGSDRVTKPRKRLKPK